MNKKAHLICVLILVSGYSFCQPVRTDAVIDMTTAGFRSLPMRPPDAVASVYLNELWINGNVVLKPDYKIFGVPIKYDLKNNMLEVMTSEGIKIANKSQLERFEFEGNIEKKRVFADASSLKIANLTGIVEQLVVGEISLYSRPYLKVIQANYNEALDVGSRTDKFVVEESLFLVKDNQAFDVTKGGKSILPYFGDQGSAMQAYAKRNKLSNKNKGGMVEIVKEYNRLRTSKN